MSYQVLALKYRPQTFDDVVGQPHVTKTLSNAISSNRVAHAILFTGPRGTGKTTIARILAKAMNCSQGPSPSPCNSCKTCSEIISGHCSDVFEIDGASNNSVDQIRDLRENVTYMPASAPYKIYIIDEVHMLSTAAFNALLKTLEEPPAHVLFIFATTEVHKIPATILSRCQRHDLGRISLEQISNHLKKLCSKEGFTVEQAGLDLIALEADGSIRDSLSLLDRILSSCTTGQVTYDQVVESLGVLDRKIMFDISSAVFSKNGADLIQVIEKINDSGLDMKKFYSDIILHFRNLNVIKLCGNKNQVVNITDVEKEKISQTVADLSEGYLGMLLQLLLKEEPLVKFSSHTRTAIEMILLKLLQINQGAQLDHIINKLDLLAKQMSTRLPDQVYGAVQKETSVREDLSPPPSAYIQEPEGTMTLQGRAESVSPSVVPSHVSSTAEPIKQKKAIQNSAPLTARVEQPRTWQGFLNHIEKKLPFMFALLTRASVNQTDADMIMVELNNCSAFDISRLKTKKPELTNHCKKFLGKDIRFDIVSENKALGSPEKKNEDFKAKQAAFNHPLVLDAKELFNGEIINY